MGRLIRCWCIFLLAAHIFVVPGSANAEQGELSSLKPSGDLRLRLEFDQRHEPGGALDGEDRRVRPRLRARAGLDYETSVEGLSLGMRLASNAGAPGNSPHQSFDLSQSNVLTIDRAFISYSPVAEVVFLAGKQHYPSWQQTEIFWDDDIQPEGFVAKFERKLGGHTGTVSANAGWFALVNNSWEDDFLQNDSFATWQLRWQGDFGDVEPSVALTGMHIRDAGEASNTDGTFEFGNTSFYQAAAQVRFGGLPVNVLAGVDVVSSTADAVMLPGSRTTAYVGQLRVARGAIGGRYYLYSVDEASVPFFGGAVLSQDDLPNSRGGGLTGFKGHRAQFDLRIAADVSFDVRLSTQKGNSDNLLAFAETPNRRITRLQFNLNAGF